MGVKKTIETDHFFKVTNISKNEQMDASELEGFLCWIFSDNPFKDQNINIKNNNSEYTGWTISEYLAHFFNENN